MDEKYTFTDLDPDQENEVLFHKHVAQGDEHLIEIDSMLSNIFSDFDVEDV